MAAKYAAYAAQVTGALQTLLETTGVSVEPAVEFVSCGAGRHEHFVPKASLEMHLRKCHGERHPRPDHDAAFYYGRNVSERAVTSGKGGRDPVEDGAENAQGEDNDGELQSLLEAGPSADQEEGLIAAIRKTATSPGDFYDQVRRWKRIPRAFATMKDNERELVTSSSLGRWLASELRRPGILPSDDPLDEELVEYVAGLLDHPDFCQPDLLALELHEFLGASVASFVLALWKFLVVEIGLHSVFKLSGVDNAIQASHLSTKHQPTAQEMIPTTSLTKDSAVDEVAERDYKRRRATFRGKIGTKTGPAAFREMIQKHMVGLSLDVDRELVLGGGFQEEKEGSRADKSQQSRPDSVNWRNFTDALEVRNRNRQDGREPRKKRRSRSRSFGRSSTRTKSPEVDDARRRYRCDSSDGYGRRSPKRHRWRSRSRSTGRSPHREHRRDSDWPKSQRRRSSSMDRSRSASRRSDRRR